MLIIASRTLGVLLVIGGLVLLYPFYEFATHVHSQEMAGRLAVHALERPCFDPDVFRAHMSGSNAFFALVSLVVSLGGYYIARGRSSGWVWSGAAVAASILVSTLLSLVVPESAKAVWVFSATNYGILIAFSGFCLLMAFLGRKHI